MAERSPPPAWLRWVVDGAPAVAFLAILLATRDFQLATWFVVGGAALSLALGLIFERRIAPLPAVTGVLALVFGGASLLLHRADILQMKMTIVDGLLGAALFGGLLFKKNPLKAILGATFELPDAAWRVLAIRYGLFWWACAIANEVVRNTQSQHTWAVFRTAVLVAAVVFALMQTPFLLRHNTARDPEAKTPPLTEPPDLEI